MDVLQGGCFFMQNKIRFVLAIEDFEEAESLKNAVEASGKACICAAVATGAALIEEAESIKPEVIISDIILPEIDGLSAFSVLKKRKNPAKFIGISEFFSADIIRESTKIGVSALVKKPYDAQILVEKALFYAEIADKQASPERKITEILRKIGIPSNVSGYRYLREAIAMTAEDAGVVNGITKLLYPEIAKKYKTTGASVERAIRHAIGLAWQNGALREMFASKPTNSELISLIADDLRLENAVK